MSRSYLTRSDPARNMRRFYLMAIETDLFGNACLITEYGRIGRAGRVTSRAFETENEALNRFNRTKRQKERRGYAAAPSFHGA